MVMVSRRRSSRSNSHEPSCATGPPADSSLYFVTVRTGESRHSLDVLHRGTDRSFKARREHRRDADRRVKAQHGHESQGVALTGESRYSADWRAKARTACACLQCPALTESQRQ